MEHLREGDVILLSMEGGEDFLEGILEAMRAQKAHGAVVLTGLGALEGAEVAYYSATRKEYDRKVLSGSHELLGLSGIIVTQPDGSFLPHIHATLAGPDHKAVGGHLLKARVSVLGEVALRIVNHPALHREKDPVFGLNGLRLKS